MISNPAVAQSIIDRALRFVRARHDWEVYCDHTWRIYQSLMRGIVVDAA
jgi:hypothetical protein